MTLLSVTDCAEILDVSAQRVRQMIARGQLRATRIGGRSWAVTERDLLRLIEERAERGVMTEEPEAE